MTGDVIPKFIEEAARAGAVEGSRNDRAFWLAAQCRDARISLSSAEGLLDLFARMCVPPLGEKEAQAALRSAWRGTPREPPVGQRSEDGGRKSALSATGGVSGTGREGGGRKARSDDDEVIPWDGEIGRPAAERNAGLGAADYSEEVPAPSGDPESDLRAWLAALYQPEDRVNYVVQSFKGEDGKYKPLGRGVTRTRADIESDLDKYAAKGHTGEALLRFVLGDWNPEAGVWARINPLDGAGVNNANVTRFDHVLVEGDEQDIGRQLAAIRSLRLPCAAIVHSGGKSVHAVVRVAAGTDKAVYAERTAALFAACEAAGLKVDVKCRNCSRLSRLPGPVRAGKPQYLVSGPCGPESFDGWLSEREEGAFRSAALGPDQLEEEPPEDSLVGDRFLCRQGAWLLVAQSGVGKSVFAMQGAVSFSVGRPLFGLRVTGPLRNLMIQAENNRGDMHETFVGVCKGLGLTKGERALLDANFRTVHCSPYSGGEFAEFVAHLCRIHRPDIVWIDPLLAYLGGEVGKMQDTGRFLRNQLSPVIEDYNCGVVMVHHTGKPPKGDDAKYKGHDLAYLGIGSSDITNWARSTSTLLRMEGCENRFVLEHGKRSDRAGCPVKAEIMHASGSDICWLPAPGKVRPEPDWKGKKAEERRAPSAASKYDGMGFEQMPPLKGDRDPEKSPVILWVCGVLESTGFPETPEKARHILRNLQERGFVKFDRETREWTGVYYDPSFG
jgi:RecA-family ATPase